MTSNRLSDLFNHLKMSLLKSILILLISAGGFSSCLKEKDDVFYPVLDATQIIGKWKLEEESHDWRREPYEYSKFNVIYEFHPNGVLSVTGVTDNIHSSGYKPGNYSYSVIDTMNFFYPGYEKFLLLEINDTLAINDPQPRTFLFIPFLSSKEMKIVFANYSSNHYFIFKKIKKKQ